jgi:hypothetical protein
MRALTLHQPWAWAIAHADKTVENRPTAPPRVVLGDDFAVHAGLAFDLAAWAAFREGRFGELARRVPDVEKLVHGAIVAVARLDAFVRGHEQLRALGYDLDLYRRWFSGPVGNILSYRRPLASPLPCRGMQGWWPLPPDVEAAVRAQIGRAA